MSSSRELDDSFQDIMCLPGENYCSLGEGTTVYGGVHPEEDGDSECATEPENGILATQGSDSNYIGAGWNKSSRHWEARIWIGDRQLKTRKKKGVQVYLGQYDTGEDAARAYDKAVIKLGFHERKVKPRPLNFPVHTYAEEIEEQKTWSDRDYFWRLRKEGVGFTKGKSVMKGVVRSKNKYEARFSYKPTDGGAKREYSLGVFESEEEAGREYDLAILFYKRDEAMTNFRPGEYSRADIAEYGRKLVEKKGISGGIGTV